MIFQNFGFNRIIIPEAAGGGEVVTTGLQAYYDIGAPSGYSGSVLYDFSGLSRDATLVGGAAYSGSNGGVIDLSAADGFIGVPSSVTSALTGSDTATIMQWIKLETDPPPADGVTGFIYMTTQTNGIGNHYPYTDDNIYTNVLKLDRPSLGNPVSNLAVWHVMTIRTSNGANNWQMLINTTSQGTDTGLASLAGLYGGGTYGAKIGESGAGNENLEGALGPTLIYNTRLSDSEIQQNIDYFASRF